MQLVCQRPALLGLGSVDSDLAPTGSPESARASRRRRRSRSHWQACFESSGSAWALLSRFTRVGAGLQVEARFEGDLEATAGPARLTVNGKMHGKIRGVHSGRPRPGPAGGLNQS